MSELSTARRHRLQCWQAAWARRMQAGASMAAPRSFGGEGEPRGLGPRLSRVRLGLLRARCCGLQCGQVRAPVSSYSRALAVCVASSGPAGARQLKCGRRASGTVHARCALAGGGCISGRRAQSRTVTTPMSRWRGCGSGTGHVRRPQAERWCKRRGAQAHLHAVLCRVGGGFRRVEGGCVAGVPADRRDARGAACEASMLQESSLGVWGRASLTCAGCVQTALASARARANCGWQSENPAMERELACGRHSCGRMTRLRARCLREQCSCVAAGNGGGMRYHGARARSRRRQERSERAKRSMAVPPT